MFHFRPCLPSLTPYPSTPHTESCNNEQTSLGPGHTKAKSATKIRYFSNLASQILANQILENVA